MKFYNTPEQKIVDFKPIEADNVKIYTCGPTVYGYQHIGNYTAFIYWDLLVRTLQANGYNVQRVLNMTDVGHLVSDADEGEDKMEKGARRDSKTAWEVSEFYANDFLKNFRAFNPIEPYKITKATDYIEEDLALIRTLKEKGYTYQINDGIYYDTSKFPKYSDFAHMDAEKLKAGARVEYNTEKRNATDFALWKFSPVGVKRDMEWETPSDLMDAEETGRMGFPGWAIECSSMIKSELGDTIDIHTGGIEHIPIHHPNEIAQSEAANGVKLANYWLHNNHAMIDGQKISKSLGNTYTPDDLIQRGFSHMDFKMWVLQGHYKSERNFSWENLAAAKARLLNWRNTAALRHQINDTVVDDADKHDGMYALSGAVLEALDDNLNSPQALALIDAAFADLDNTNLEKINRKSLVKLVEFLDEVFGLKLMESTPDVNDETKKLILERRTVRDDKDWEKSDLLRAEIEKVAGITLKDTPVRTIWEYK